MNSRKNDGFSIEGLAGRRPETTTQSIQTFQSKPQKSNEVLLGKSGYKRSSPTVKTSSQQNSTLTGFGASNPQRNQSGSMRDILFGFESNKKKQQQCLNVPAAATGQQSSDAMSTANSSFGKTSSTYNSNYMRNLLNYHDTDQQ